MNDCTDPQIEEEENLRLSVMIHRVKIIISRIGTIVGRRGMLRRRGQFSDPGGLCTGAGTRLGEVSTGRSYLGAESEGSSDLSRESFSGSV